MRPFAIRLTICATALVVFPAMTPAKAKVETEAGRKHTRINRHQHHWRHHYGTAWPVAPARSVVGTYPPTEPVCPGIGRSFDCKIWPPPYADDPDRKTSRF
jgi:hypothetical protein